MAKYGRIVMDTWRHVQFSLWEMFWQISGCSLRKSLHWTFFVSYVVDSRLMRSSPAEMSELFNDSVKKTEVCCTLVRILYVIRIRDIKWWSMAPNLTCCRLLSPSGEWTRSKQFKQPGRISQGS